jgi:ATP-dependent DNA helicase RecQ
MNVLNLTDYGRAFLRERKSVRLTRPMPMPASKGPRTGDITCDEALFERLRELRKHLADERGVPPYIVFSDVALRQMARTYPTNAQEFRAISGVGDRKLADFGEDFLADIADYLGSHPKQMFADDSFQADSARTAPVRRRSALTGTVLASLQAFRQGRTIPEIAGERGLSAGTIYTHLTTAVEAGETVELRRLLTAVEQEEIERVLTLHPGRAITPAHEALKGRYEFGLLHLIRAFMAARR